MYLVHVTTGIIFIFALFEYFFRDTYLKVFSVNEYYVARGTLDPFSPSLQFCQWALGGQHQGPGTGARAANLLGRSSLVVTISGADRLG